jgi:hypothetical protein
MDLPDDLRSLVWLSALSITAGTYFDVDCQRLAAAIKLVLEKAAAEQQEREKKERLEGEKREKDRLEVERLDAEHRRRLESEHDQNKGNILPPSSAPTQDLGPAPAEAPPVIEKSKLLFRLRVLVARFRVQLTIGAMMVIVFGMWFATGSRPSYRGRLEAKRLNPITESSPTSAPSSTPTSTPQSTSAPTRDRYISKYLSATPSGTPQSTSTPTSESTPKAPPEGKVPPTVQALIEQLEDADADARHAAATSLGKMGVNAKGAVPALIQRVADDVWGTQGEGVRVAVNTDNASGNTSKDAALKALKQLAPDRVEEVLIKGTKSTNPRTRAWGSAPMANP